MESRKQSANQISTTLVKATGVLEAVKNDEAAALLDQAIREAEEFSQLLEQPLPHTRLYIGKPSPIRSLTETTATKDTIMLKWEDPDNGESEIHSYKVISVTGFWGEETVLATVKNPNFVHKGLEPGKKLQVQNRAH